MQSLGGALGGYMFLKIKEAEDIDLNLGFCINDLGPWSALAFESSYDIIMLYSAFGSAFDKTQGQLYGPIAGPVMIGLNLTILLWMTSGFVPLGYVWGANPAFCIAAAIGYSDWSTVWLSWAGGLLACVVNALLYVYIPPHHATLYEERRSFTDRRTVKPTS